jgi:hypothetical protein
VYFWRVYLPYSLEQRAKGGISFAESGKVSPEARAQKHFSGMLWLFLRLTPVSLSTPHRLRFGRSDQETSQLALKQSSVANLPYAEIRMNLKKLSVFAGSAGMALSLVLIPALQAHAAASDADASGATMSKKNAELSTLEKNGYNPGGSQTNYPQNLQNAQQKAAGQKPMNAPAVAP